MNGKNLMDDDLVDREAQQVDTYPLLMDHLASQQQEHVIEVGGDSLVPSSSSNQGEFLRSRPADVTPASSSSSAESLRSIRNYGGHRQRMSPLNSGLWISIELTVTVSQIIASIIVLSLSRDEKPQTPLSVWVAGYAAGCLATLPVLYWRYTHRHGPRIRDQESLSQSTPTASVPPSPRTASSYVSLSIPSASSDSRVTSTRNSESFTDNTSVARLVEKFKIALDCFFAVWFVVGNVWIFGGHSSSREAPNLYRLCIVFLTFSCIGYAMPFILCATICCCLPCIIALLGFREEQNQNRGASPEVIAALPVYKFKAKERDKGDSTTTTTNNSNNTDKIDKDSSDSESEGPNEGGVVAAGTDKERVVSGDDAVCCICLARYKDEEQLRELSCGHHFHVDCVDKWLKINSLCPLCKLDVGGGGSNDAAAATSAAAAVAADVDVVDDRTS